MADTVVQYVINISAQNAERSLDNLAKSSNQASRSMDKLGDESKDTSRDLNKLSRDSKKVGGSMRSTSIDISKLSKSMGAFTAGIGLAVGAISTLAVGVIKFQQDIADLTNELTDASAKSGIAIETLSGLRLAAEGSGLAFSNLEGGLVQFQTKIRDASNGSKEMETAFNALGVSITNSQGELRNSNQVFNDSIRALGRLQNETERNAIALKLFGRSAGAGLIQSGALDNLDAMTQKAQRFGVSINKDAIGAMGDFQRAMADFELVASGTFEDILDSLFGEGSITEGIKKATEEMIFFGSITQDILKTVSQLFENSFGSIQVFIFGLEALFKAKNLDFEGAFSSIDQGARLIIDLARDTGDVLSDLGNTIATASEKADEFRRIGAGGSSTSGIDISDSDSDSDGGTGIDASDNLTQELNKALAVITKMENEFSNISPEIQIAEANVRELTRALDTLSQEGLATADDYELLVEAEKRLSDTRKRLAEETANQIKTTLEQLAINSDESLSKFSDQFGDGLAIGLIQAINPALAEVARVAQKALSSAVDKVDVLATGSVSDIVSLIAPVIGQSLGVLEEIGKKTPEERRQELLDEVQAIRDGISFLPEIFLSILPQLALALTEAIFDGTVKAFQNLIELIVNSFNNLFSFRDVSPDGERETLRSRIGDFLRDFFDPSTSATFASGGRFIPSAESGIRFTGMSDGLAMLHRGEFVVPQSGQRPQQVDRQLNRSGGGMNIVINSLVTEQNAVDQLVRQIENRFNNSYGTSSSNLFGGR